MNEHINVDKFITYVHEKGFEIQDNLFTHGVRRFIISKNDSTLHFDIDRVVWDNCTLESLIHQIDMIDDNWPRKDVPDDRET